MSLAGWLDAGYAMLIEGADLEWRELLEQLLESPDDESMAAAFEAIAVEGRWRRAQHDSAEQERRRRSGAPPRTKLLAPGALDAAVEEWEQIVAEGQATGGAV